MNRTLQFSGALLLTLTCIGCIEAELETKLERDIAALQANARSQEEKIKRLEAQVNDGLTLALCTPELRQLLEDVQKECTRVSGSGAGICSTQQIRPAVMSADPEHRGRFLKLMSHLPHEVVYIAKDATAILPYRLERLEHLTRPALLKSTVFLVVSSPEAGDTEAVRRAAHVEKLLMEFKIPPNILRRWLYAFPANKADIVRQSDLPGLVETKDLHRGVWVFRADC